MSNKETDRKNETAKLPHLSYESDGKMGKDTKKKKNDTDTEFGEEIFFNTTQSSE